MTLRILQFILLLMLAVSSQAGNAAIEAAPREGGWMQRHDGFVAEASQGNIDVLFLGDSITDAWRTKGKAIWDQHFAPLKAANFGISGDRTQHVLWRLRNGEATGYQPKAVVLMIGTNNTGLEKDGVTPRNTPEEIIEGVTAVVNELKSAFPKTKILLLAVFPRAEKPDAPQRLQVNAVNAGIAKLHDGRRVHFLDIGKKFLDAEGNLPKEIMPDFLHPNEKGYEIWADAIRQPLARLLK